MIKICTMLMIVLIIISCLFFNTFLHAQEDTPATVSSQEELPNEIIKRTPKIEMYRCDECHDSEESFNSKIRPMAKDKDHESITTFHPEKKDDPNFWCNNCHASKNYNKLILQSEEKISFNESYRLCGQCHGPTLKDWKNNIHGKVVGGWLNNKKQHSCTSCHNAHDPKMKQVDPIPEPTRSKKS